MQTDKIQTNKKWDRNRELFNKYITPNLKDIRSLVGYYASSHALKDDLYSLVLEDFYRYIHTYDPEKKLDTWIHICVKRKVFAEEARYRKRHAFRCDYLLDENIDNAIGDDECILASDPLNPEYYKNSLGDDIYHALYELDEKLRVPLLLLCNGYSIKEITEHEYEHGRVSWLSHSAIKTRISLAKKKVQDNLVYYETNDELKKILLKLNE